MDLILTAIFSLVMTVLVFGAGAFHLTGIFTDDANVLTIRV